MRGKRGTAGWAASIGAAAFACGCSLFSDFGGLTDAPPDPTTPDGGAADVQGIARDAASIPTPPGSDGGGEADAAPEQTCAWAEAEAKGCTFGSGASYFPDSGGEARARKTGDVEVVVFGQFQPAVENGVTNVDDERLAPHVLVLASYSATRWSVNATKPSAITAIVLSGFAPSSVDAPPGVTIENTTPETPHAVTYPSPDATALFAHAVARAPGGATAVTTFAGCYRAAEFRVRDSCN